MDVVAPVVTPVVESIIKVIKRHVGYVVSSTNNVNEMRTNMEELNAMARDMKMKKETNVVNNLMVPHYVPTWLTDVEKIYEKVGNVPTGGTGCFNIKARYRAGKRSFDILKDIDRLKKQRSEIKWSDEQRPLGKVRSTIPYTSDDPVANDIDNQNVIKSSRDLIFDKALKSLEPNNNCQMMALCGMGGIGKTTMMEQLKKVVVDRKMFDWVVKVVVGENKNQIGIQDAIADYIGQPLTEKDKYTRAERLRKKFEGILEDGSKKILVILDDLWEEMDLKDIGLTTPLPKGFKLLLTSRKEKVCTTMGVETDSIFKIGRLDEREAKNMFWQIARINPDCDRDLLRIGEDILKKCGGLPMAIKTIASTLKDDEDKETWKNALDHFQEDSTHYLKNIFEISYNYLKDDDEKAIFLLCGLFPDDHNIRIEDLTRYGWGLKLFKKLDSISKARRRVITCVGNLISSNLLIESDTRGCVKIHDLLRDFLLSNFSNVKQASLVNNDNLSDQLKENSYERLLLKCGGMVELPADFIHPYLALLNLMDGKKLTKFPEEFYTNMNNLQVVAYAGIDKPLLPRRLINLRTTTFHRELDSCKSLGDISFLGDLTTLEVLSLAYCGISNLPSSIGNLKNLKLLDLTGSAAADLCIDDGVFQSLNKLEELYMRTQFWKPVRFTEDSCEGLKMVSSKLTALEVEFFKSILEPKNVSFKQLERFRISIGTSLDSYTSENTLILFTSKEEILECKIDELFEKTEELQLSVTGMSCLEDISKHPSEYPFFNLKALQFFNCVDLTYIFTVNVVSSLTKLEMLSVSSCPHLESLVQGENNGANKPITFHKLKSLLLMKLPKFVRLCDGDEVMDLPQLMTLSLNDLSNVTCIFNENSEISSTTQVLLKTKVLIPNLEMLRIDEMEKLKEIWCDNTTSSSLEEVHIISALRDITVRKCNSMVNLFPRNPMRLLTHLQTLVVDECSSIEVLFNIDLQQQGCVGQTDYVSTGSSLRNIRVDKLENLREVWRVKGDDTNSTGIIIRDFQSVESLLITNCHKFRSMLTPTTIRFDMGALTYMRVVTNSQKSSFCESDSYFFSPLMATLLSNLKTVEFCGCEGMEEVVSNRDGEEDENEKMITTSTTTTLFPHLDSLILRDLPILKHVGGGVSKGTTNFINDQRKVPQVGVVYRWSLCQYSRCIYIRKCHALSSVIPSYTAGQSLKVGVMEIEDCKSMKEVFSSTIENDNGCHTTISDEISVATASTCPILTRHGNITAHNLSNLKTLNIFKCDSLEYVFTFSTLESLKKLKEIRIRRCKAMKVIVREEEEEEGDQTITAPNNNKVVVVFPRVEVIQLISLSNLEGFFLGNQEFQWPQLSDVCITGCPKMTAFTCSSKSIARRLKYVKHPIFGEVSPKPYNFYMTAALYQVTSPSLETTTSCPEISNDDRHRSLQDIKELNVENAISTVIVEFNELLQLQNLEKIHAKTCILTQKIFEVELEVTDHEFNNESQKTTVVKLLKLREVDLEEMFSLKYLWKNNKWRQLELPNLTRLSIHKCHQLNHVFTTSMVGSLMHLQELHLSNCMYMTVIVKEEEEGYDGGKKSETMFPNLRRLYVHNCSSLVPVFTTSMVGCFMQLQELHVTHCSYELKEIVKENDDCERKVLPCLKSLKLEHLRWLKGFCLWKKNFAFPSLSTLVIKQCPDLSVFTNGSVDTPMLKVIETNEGLIDVGEQDINSFIIAKKKKGRHFRRDEESTDDE